MASLRRGPFLMRKKPQNLWKKCLQYHEIRGKIVLSRERKTTKEEIKMTYKKIVANMVEADAIKWAEKVIRENGYGEVFVWSDGVELEHDKEGDMFLWTVSLTVSFHNDIISRHVDVSGTVDDVCGICHSVIWSKNHNILWMNVPQTRETLGITKFDIDAA